MSQPNKKNMILKLLKCVPVKQVCYCHLEANGDITRHRKAVFASAAVFLNECPFLKGITFYFIINNINIKF